MVEGFATEHHISLPTFIDPNGELAAKVKADYALQGEKVGIDHTPTVYVVSNSQQRPYIEVKNRLSQLFSMIDQINTQLAGRADSGSQVGQKRIRQGSWQIPCSIGANAGMRRPKDCWIRSTERSL